MMKKLESPVISVPGRLDYFPPISSPATMFQKRKKKSVRELYRLTPQTHDLVLHNPPVTPWDEPPEFFRTFIGTPENIKNNADLRTTWPFLRQLGPKCVFKGMRKKRKDGDHAYVIHLANGVNSKYVYADTLEDDRLLEPECIGIGNAGSSPRVHFFTTCSKLQNAIVRINGQTQYFQDGPMKTRSDLSSRKVKAPPPSETRSTKSDDSNNSRNRFHDLSLAPFSHRQTPHGLRTRDTKVEFDKCKCLHINGEQFVNFKKSPLPERLQQVVLSNSSDPAEEMCKLTWRDIMQTRAAAVRADHATRIMGAKHAEVTDEIQSLWRLPKSRKGPGNSTRMINREQHKRDVGIGRVNQRDIATWIENVSKAQTCTGNKDVTSPEVGNSE